MRNADYSEPHTIIRIKYVDWFAADAGAVYKVQQTKSR